MNIISHPSQAPTRRHRALILAPDGQPLQLQPVFHKIGIRWKDAVVAVLSGYAETIETYEGVFVHSPSITLKVPAVIQLYQVPEEAFDYQRAIRTKPSSEDIYLRDFFSCQYCGGEGEIKGVRLGLVLTLDHVIAKAHGGPNTWDNLVACCEDCNTRKADLTLEQAASEGLILRSEPCAPQPAAMWHNFVDLNLVAPHNSWKNYLLNVT